MKLLGDRGPSWTERIRLIKEEARATYPPPPERIVDSWEAILTTLEGEVHDGYARIPTHVVFDHLGLRRSERNSGSARRLAKAMRALGWETSRFRPVPGTHQRVRGFV